MTIVSPNWNGKKACIRCWKNLTEGDFCDVCIIAMEGILDAYKAKEEKIRSRGDLDIKARYKLLWHYVRTVDRLDNLTIDIEYDSDPSEKIAIQELRINIEETEDIIRVFDCWYLYEHAERNLRQRMKAIQHIKNYQAGFTDDRENYRSALEKRKLTGVYIYWWTHDIRFSHEVREKILPLLQDWPRVDDIPF